MGLVDDITDEYMEITKLEKRKDIIGLEGIYQVSSLGRVRGLDRIQSDGRTRAGKIIQLSRAGDGNYKVNLMRDGRVSSIPVTKLVYCTFRQLDYRKYDHLLEHIDGNPENNRFENIRPSKLNHITKRKAAYKLMKKIESKTTDEGIIFDILNKVDNQICSDGVTESKKAKDTERFILDFIQETNLGYEDDDDEFRNINQIRLSEFFNWIQKKV